MSNPKESHDAAVDATRAKAEEHAKAEAKRNREAETKVHPELVDPRNPGLGAK